MALVFLTKCDFVRNLTVSIFKTAKGATTFYLFTTVRPVNAVSVAVTIVTTPLRLVNRVETCSALNRCRYNNVH